jgi:4-carboxymuconolactone decarboxylase
MRLPLIRPPQLTDSQRPLYDAMKAGITRKYSTFITMLADGTLLGPWGAWLHEPEVGTAIYALTNVMTAFRILPDTARQVVILVVGSHYKAAYELYAHSAVGRSDGISDEQLATIATGNRPSDLSGEAELAYDVASALVGGGILPTLAYERAREVFGPRGIAEIIYLVGYYCLVSVTLNGFDVPVPTDST